MYLIIVNKRKEPTLTSTKFKENYNNYRNNNNNTKIL